MNYAKNAFIITFFFFFEDLVRNKRKVKRGSKDIIFKTEGSLLNTVLFIEYP